jgi:signal transduction histidine kinase
MTRHGGRNVIDIWQSALDSGATAAATPLILRSTIIQDRSKGSSQPRRPFEELLLEHCERIVASGRSQERIVQLELNFEGICPATHERTVLRVADELLSNAMEHGYYARQGGHVFVHVISYAGVGVQVSVSDDGWGFDSGPIIDGNGFHLLRQIGDLYYGAAAAPFMAKSTVTVIIPLHRARTAYGNRGAVLTPNSPIPACHCRDGA